VGPRRARPRRRSLRAHRARHRGAARPPNTRRAADRPVRWARLSALPDFPVRTVLWVDRPCSWT